MVLNRLIKNQRKLNGWLNKTGASCYRVYDADIPEYAVAVDIYEDSVHVQEYAAAGTPLKTVKSPASASPKLSKRSKSLPVKLPAAVSTTKSAVVRRATTSIKNLMKAPATPSPSMKGDAQFEANLSDYLDTGLFLDHRPVRRMVA